MSYRLVFLLPFFTAMTPPAHATAAVAPPPRPFLQDVKNFHGRLKQVALQNQPRQQNFASRIRKRNGDDTAASGIEALEKLTKEAPQSLDEAHLIQRNMKRVNILLNSNIEDRAPTAHELVVMLKSIMDVAQHDYIFDLHKGPGAAQYPSNWRQTAKSRTKYWDLFFNPERLAENNLHKREAQNTFLKTERTPAQKVCAFYTHVLMEMARSLFKKGEENSLTTYTQYLEDGLNRVLHSQTHQPTKEYVLLQELRIDATVFQNQIKTILFMDDDVGSSPISNAFKDVFDGYKLKQLSENDDALTHANVSTVIEKNVNVRYVTSLIGDQKSNFEEALTTLLEKSTEESNTKSNPLAQKKYAPFLWQNEQIREEVPVKKVKNWEHYEEQDVPDDAWSSDDEDEETLNVASHAHPNVGQTTLRNVNAQLVLLEKYVLDYITIEDNAMIPGHERFLQARRSLEAHDLLPYFSALREQKYPTPPAAEVELEEELQEAAEERYYNPKSVSPSILPLEPYKFAFLHDIPEELQNKQRVFCHVPVYKVDGEDAFGHPVLRTTKKFVNILIDFKRRADEGEYNEEELSILKYVSTSMLGKKTDYMLAVSSGKDAGSMIISQTGLITVTENKQRAFRDAARQIQNNYSTFMRPKPQKS